MNFVLIMFRYSDTIKLYSLGDPPTAKPVRSPKRLAEVQGFGGRNTTIPPL